MSRPDNCRYTKEHEWALREGENVRVGVTDFAIEQLGDITLVDLPKVGTKVEAHKRFGDIESVKTVSELFSPISGEVVAINEAVLTQPELVNAGAYDQGWLVLIKQSSPADYDSLMSASDYESYLKSQS